MGTMRRRVARGSHIIAPYVEELDNRVDISVCVLFHAVHTEQY